MATPGFPPGTLDDLGCPVWLTNLADEDPNHTVHMVRDLDPTDALLSLGVKPHRSGPVSCPRRVTAEHPSAGGDQPNR